MTNRFRFHTKDNTSMIYDTENKVYYFCIDLNDICDLLNELHEENQAVEDVLIDLNKIDSYWDSALLQGYINEIANILGVDLE